METQIAGSIARMDGSTSQDAIFKDVLAYKEVLAHIMKTCVPEYKDCTIPQIIGYIEPNPQVGQVGLHPDETNPPKIQGMSTESTTTTEERVVYDVRFSAVAPGEDGKIGLIINIEAQSKYHPGYPLVKRAIYYCGRMLSAQYGSVFTQSHYGEIQKVYSIWICTRPPKERENTITSYTLQERHLVGHVTEPVRNYDLMNVTMICLGKPEGKHYGGLLRMLEVLFTGRYAAKEVIQILEDEYEFAHAHTMERTVSEMCNLSQGIFEEGMEKGMAQGMEKGIEKGIAQGIAQGIERGIEKGIAQGIERGMEKGIAQGMERGIAQGMEKGIERGTNRERLQNIRSLMETTGWPAEQVMTAMKIPAADQPKYLKLLSLPQ